MIDEKWFRYVDGLLRGDDHLSVYFREQMARYDALERRALSLWFAMKFLILLAVGLLLALSVAGVLLMRSPSSVQGIVLISVLGLLAVMAVVFEAELHRDLGVNLAERGLLFDRCTAIITKREALNLRFRELQARLKEDRA